MQESTTREKMLKKIRNALISKTANPYHNLDFDSPVFRMNDDVPELIFTGLQGSRRAICVLQQYAGICRKPA